MARRTTLAVVLLTIFAAGCTTEEIIVVRQRPGAANPQSCVRSVCDVEYTRCATPPPDTTCSDCNALCHDSISADGLMFCLQTCSDICARPKTPLPAPPQCAWERDACRETDANLGCADGLADGQVPSTNVPSGIAWQPPSAPHQGACTAEEIDKIMKDCAPAPEPRYCGNVSMACFECAFPSESAQTWGPFVREGKKARLNTEGCWASVAGDGTIDGCGAKQRATTECLVAACKHAKAADFSDCTYLAQTSVCKAALDAEDACKASDVAAARAKGAPTPDEVCRPDAPGRTEAHGRLVLTYFCGR
ncbi:MAG: hypothetical protein KF819_16700 [Labilithrix sp.]|nr:hypothetical protein [Labilithrix sp.]